MDAAAREMEIMWGDDYLRLYPPKTPFAMAHLKFVVIQSPGAPAYEFGLRADGVVVWREIKK